MSIRQSRQRNIDKFKKIADNIGPLQQAEVAARNFAELSAADYALYAEFLTRASTPSDCTIPPPDEAVTVLIAVRKSTWFHQDCRTVAMVGKWARVAVHGRVSGDGHPPYITKADAIRSGDCG